MGKVTKTTAKRYRDTLGVIDAVHGDSDLKAGTFTYCAGGMNGRYRATSAVAEIGVNEEKPSPCREHPRP